MAAWSSIQPTVALGYYVHDFALGSFSFSFNLDLFSGIDQINPTGFYTNQTLRTYDSWVPSSVGTSSASLVNHPTQGFSVLMRSVGNIATNADIDGITKNIQVQSVWMTRTHMIAAGGYGTFGGTLAGPYELTYATAGTKTIDLNLYVYTGLWDGPPSSAPLPTIGRFNLRTLSVQLIQEAVAVINQNSSVGPTLADNSTLSMDTLSPNNVIVLNKSNNRGDDYASSWTIQKQNPSTMAWAAAVAGTHYTLGPGETLTSDQITLTWQLLGQYRVLNLSEGSAPFVGANYDTCTINFSVAQSVVDVVTLPIVRSIVTPVVAYNNTTVSLTPLTGVTNFQISVSALVDASLASWVQTIGIVTTTIVMTDADWVNELNSRCTIRCYVKQGAFAIQTRNGFGPHIFNLSPGNYSVGYSLTPKTGSIIIPGGNISIPVPPGPGGI